MKLLTKNIKHVTCKTLLLSMLAISSTNTLRASGNSEKLQILINYFNPVESNQIDLPTIAATLTVMAGESALLYHNASCKSAKCMLRINGKPEDYTWQNCLKETAQSVLNGALFGALFFGLVKAGQNSTIKTNASFLLPIATRLAQSAAVYGLGIIPVLNIATAGKGAIDRAFKEHASDTQDN